MDRLHRQLGDPEEDVDARVLGVPGKVTLTSRLAPRLMRAGAGAGTVAPDAESAVAAAAGSGGSVLRDDVRARFEASLGADLADVRVHTGDSSAAAAASVSAKAYTVGNDIHFGADQLQPDDPFGLHLLAHEVAHTVQQGGAPSRPQFKLEVSVASDGVEVEADRAADAMVAGRPASVSSVGGGTIARKDAPAPAPVETPVRGRGSAMVADDLEAATLYPRPDERSTPTTLLPKGKVVKLLSTAGGFHGVEVDGKKSYVKIMDVITAVDTPPAEKEAEWAAKGAAASKAIDDAGHQVGGAATGGAGTAPLGAGGSALPQWFMDLQNKLMLLQVWEAPEEDAQLVLESYATWYLQSYHGGKVPASLASMFQYIGRSSQNAAAAKKCGAKNTGHYGGSKGGKNWCTQTTTTGVLDGLAALGYAPKDANTFWNTILWAKPSNGEKMTIGAPAAYTAPLFPGDMVMFLFDGAQYGGHTVTVVDDLGDSFTHASGNTGAGIGAGLGVATRMKAVPSRKDGKAFSLTECNKSASPEEMTASTTYIAGCNWGGKDNKLIYSIARFSYLFEELGQLADIDPATQADLEQQIMTRYKLKKLPAPAATATPPVSV